MSQAYYSDTTKILQACEGYLEFIVKLRDKKLNKVLDKYIKEENEYFFRKNKFDKDEKTNRDLAKVEIEKSKDKERQCEYYTMLQNCLVWNSEEHLRVETLIFMIKTADQVYISIEDMCMIKGYIK